MKRRFLGGLCLFLFLLSAPALAGSLRAIDQLMTQRRFSLEEVQCNMDFWATRVNVQDSEGRALGYFQTRFWSWNGDLVWYGNDGQPGL